MADASVFVNMETIWCVSCAVPTIVEVALMNSHRSHGRDVFCSGCGRRHNKREDAPSDVARREYERRVESENESTEREVKMGRTIAGLRGALARAKKRGAK